MTNNADIRNFHIVKISQSKSSSKINIPVDFAKSTGIDKAKHVIIIKTGEKTLEVKRYDGPKDFKEYF